MSDLKSPVRAIHDVIVHGRAVAFWVAVVGPFIYLPLALVGLPTVSDQFLFVGLVVLHVVALYAGHPHNRPDSQRPEVDDQTEVRA